MYTFSPYIQYCSAIANRRPTLYHEVGKGVAQQYLGQPLTPRSTRDHFHDAANHRDITGILRMVLTISEGFCIGGRDYKATTVSANIHDPFRELVKFWLRGSE